jgi:hypothetical protein
MTLRAGADAASTTLLEIDNPRSTAKTTMRLLIVPSLAEKAQQRESELQVMLLQRPKPSS